MAGKAGERSASSATRFTATTPHASSKTGSAAAKPTLRSKPAAGAGGPTSKKTPPPPAGPSAGAETPEQRVARLRAAHQAAKNAKVSRFDQILAKSRPYFDSAHRITVLSLVGLTAVAGLMTAYTAYDMLRHNRQRKIEFQEAQRQMSADSLEAARLAYMRGEATDEQIARVDEANARAEGFQMPSLLSAPKPLGNVKAAEDSASTVSSPEAQPPQNISSKIWGLLTWSKKEEGQGAAEATAAGEKPPKSLEEKRAMLESARAAFEKEKENQRNGGPLDRVGTEAPAVDSAQPKDEQPKKKGWLW